MRAWHVCPRWSVALGAAAKCGSTMLANLISINSPQQRSVRDSRHDRVYWHDIPARYRRVAIVRHPVRRFQSLVSNIRERPRQDSNFYKQFETMSDYQIAQWLDVNGTEHDIHIQPQVVALGPGPYELVRLMDFDQWWRTNFPCAAAPQLMNRSNNHVLADAPTVELLKEIYAGDFAIWERAYADLSSCTDSARAS